MQPRFLLYPLSAFVLFAGTAAFAAPSKDDIAALEKASISMTKAISAAEKNSGGKAIDVTFDEEGKNGGVYEITVILNGKTEHYKVDAASQNVSKDTTILAKLDNEGKGEKMALSSAKLSLADAVSKAESSASGKAISAELEEHDKVSTYQVQVVAKGDIVAVAIDPMSGQVKQRTLKPQ